MLNVNHQRVTKRPRMGAVKVKRKKEDKKTDRDGEDVYARGATA